MTLNLKLRWKSVKAKKIDLKKIPKDEFVCIAKRKGIGTFVYVPSNYPGPIAQDATIRDENKKG